MNTRADKSIANKGQVIPGNAAAQWSAGKDTIHLQDNRFKFTVQKKQVEGLTNSNPAHYVIQRLIDDDVPKETRVYVSNANSEYYRWEGKTMGKSKSENMMIVKIGDRSNWRTPMVTKEFSIYDLVQMPVSENYHDQSLSDATHSQLGTIKEAGLEQENSGIVEGRFTGKKKEDGSIDTSIHPTSIRELRESVLDFTGHTRKISERVKSDQRRAGMFLRVYRGMHSQQIYNLKPGAVITESMPFSTTFNKNFAKKWAETDIPGEAVIMCIDLPVSFPMIFLSSPRWLGNFTLFGNQIVNQAQQEVTIAPMTFRIMDAHIDGGYKVFNLLAEDPLSDEEIAQIFGDATKISAQIRAEKERRHQEEEDAREEEEDARERIYQAYAEELGEGRS